MMTSDGWRAGQWHFACDLRRLQGWGRERGWRVMEGCGARESPAEDVSSGSTTANGPCCVAEMAAIGLAPYYVHRLATSVGMCQELSCELRTLSLVRLATPQGGTGR